MCKRVYLKAKEAEKEMQEATDMQIHITEKHTQQIYDRSFTFR